jgi:hypothetical protein
VKIKTSVDEATLGSAKGTSQFSIKASAKAFSILSSGLYSNKIKAIIRELSCNAYDAHVLNGNPDEPFVVKLPNQIDPSFYVRDFGVGLTHEEVTTLYTTYFESTKQDSNDYIGALGLGSKSPFSYTQNFSVISIKDGWKGIYTAYIDEQGCPAIALMQEMETDERNGLEVRFSVSDSYDIRKFAEEASSVFKWFKTHPKVTGDSYFRTEEITYLEKDIVKGVHIRAERYGSRALAIQGNIAYPIDITSSVDLGGLSYLLRQPLVIEFEIGDLDIAASREKLSFDDRTIQNIKARLREVQDGVKDYCKKQLEGISNQWELMRKIKSLNETELFRPSMAEIVKSGVCKLLTVRADYVCDSDALLIKKAWLDSKGISLIHMSKKYYGDSTISERNLVKTSEKGPDDKLLMAYDFTDDYKFVFILNDKKTGPRARVRYHFKKRGYDKAHLIVFSVNEGKDIELEIKKFRKKLHNPTNVEIFKIDDLDKKERKVKNIGAGLMELEYRSGFWMSDSGYKWDSVCSSFEEDPGETYYYVPLSNYTVLNRDGVTECSWNFLEEWTNIRSAKLFGSETVYGVRKSYINLIEGRENWVNVFDVIEKNMRKRDAMDVIRSYIANDTYKKQYQTLKLKKEQLLQDGSLMVEFLNKYSDYFHSHTDHTVDVNGYERLYKKFGVDIPDVTKVKNEFEGLRQRILDRYKILDKFTYYSDDELLVEYINQMDELIKLRGDNNE